MRKHIQIVFQDPFWSLNPRMLVRDVVGEPLNVHLQPVPARNDRRGGEAAGYGGAAADSVYKYPHEFSGGQRQRIAIARALALEPKLVVLDEPTSSIDILSQAQILDLLIQLKQRLGLTYILISHDLSVVHYMSDRIIVMYLGKVVEQGPADAGVQRRRCTPTPRRCSTPSRPLEMNSLDELETLEGSVPSAIDPPSGCRFHTRCPFAMPVCSAG